MMNPFLSTFESLTGPASPVVSHLHQNALQRLEELVRGDDGALLLLRAPRAGYGKTMLLSRLQAKVKGEMAMIPISLTGGSGLDEERVLETVLTGLTGATSPTNRLTRLDEITRRLFAHGLIPLLESGEVPSHDLEGALRSLRDRPAEVFDFHDEEASVAQWTRTQFKELSPKFVAVLANTSGASPNDVTSWLNLLFRFSTCSPEEVGRLGELMDAIFGEMSRFRTGSGYHGALISFLKVISLVESVTLILDEIDGLFGNAESALRLASQLIEIGQLAPKTKVIVSVNDDVWESAFSPKLPMGVRDRLEDRQIRLSPMDPISVVDLLKSRNDEETTEIFKRLELRSDELYPRAVLRRAREVWDEMENGVVAAPRIPELDSTGIGFAEVHEGQAPSAKMEREEIPKDKGMSYPPGPVRRVSLPRKFAVERICEKPPLTLPPIKSPFKIADQSAVSLPEAKPPIKKAVQPPPLPSARDQRKFKPSQNPFKPKAPSPASPEEASAKAKSIKDLLRQFRDDRPS